MLLREETIAQQVILKQLGFIHQVLHTVHAMTAKHVIQRSIREQCSTCGRNSIIKITIGVKRRGVISEIFHVFTTDH